MRPLAELDRPVDAILTDIDGTLTGPDGRIPASVFQALERAKAAGLLVVPVTGRPAGWCDLIARTWPVDGVVGENGGLAFRRVDRGGVDKLEALWAQTAEERRTNRARLTELSEAVLTAFPGAALASDQGYREFDLAVDFCEDVAPLSEAEIDGIVALLKDAGCTVKVSNIHVNAWFGAFDKASMCRRFLSEAFGWDLDGADRGRVAFFGDSPNDSPLFGLAGVPIGVANVGTLAHRMDRLPDWICQGDGAAGFVEGVDHLLSLRR